MQSTFTLFTGNLMSPPVLSFIFGVIAIFVRSDLRIPSAIYKAMTIYLLFAIGLKGGSLLSLSTIGEWLLPCCMVLIIGTSIPLVVYPIARKWLNLQNADAASLAVHYGSVSAVTFIACQTYLISAGIRYESYLTALLALMEIPAILMGLMLAKVMDNSKKVSIRSAFKETLRGSSIFLLIAGLIVGALSTAENLSKVTPFFVEPFYGVLVLFLLELGLVAGAQIKLAKELSYKLLIFALLVPCILGPIGLICAWAIGLSQGGAILVAVLCGSASYIAAPAATRIALPEANPAYTITTALGITFPFNLCFGIPLFTIISQILY